MFSYSHGMLTVLKQREEIACSNVGREIWRSGAMKQGAGVHLCNVCCLHVRTRVLSARIAACRKYCALPSWQDMCICLRQHGNLKLESGADCVAELIQKC